TRESPPRPPRSNSRGEAYDGGAEMVRNATLRGEIAERAGWGRRRVLRFVERPWRRDAACPAGGTPALRRRHVRFVDLDERVLAQTVDVCLVVTLPGLVADVLAQLLLQRLERRHFGGQALLDFQDVPGGLGFDRADDLAGRGVEDGFVELGEELAA